MTTIAKLTLSLLCLTVLLLATNAGEIQPVRGFQLSKLLNNVWYEIMFADKVVEELGACTRVIFTDNKNGTMTYTLGNLTPGLNGKFYSLGDTFIVGNHGSNGKYPILGDTEGNYFYVVDYDRNYNWVIWGDTKYHLLSAMSTVSQNVDLTTRLLEYAVKAGYESQNLALQTNMCPYNSVVNQLRQAISNA